MLPGKLLSEVCWKYNKILSLENEYSLYRQVWLLGNGHRITEVWSLHISYSECGTIFSWSQTSICSKIQYNLLKCSFAIANFKVALKLWSFNCGSSLLTNFGYLIQHQQQVNFQVNLVGILEMSPNSSYSLRLFFCFLFFVFPREFQSPGQREQLPTYLLVSGCHLFRMILISMPQIHVFFNLLQERKGCNGPLGNIKSWSFC